MPLISGLVALILILVAGAYLAAQNQSPNEAVQPTSDPPGDNQNLNGQLSPTPDLDQLNQEEWLTYRSAQFGFEITHPGDMETRNLEDNSATFTYIGPTQTLGTELFDGISIAFRGGDYEEPSFRQFVEAARTEITNDPVNPRVGPLSQVSVAGIQGFSFTVSSLGDYRYYYLPKNDNQYLLITVLAPDPQNRGYQQIVDRMLSTLSFK
jgi:hypothetical protein